MATSEGLDRVFNNLISNAVKYTLLGGKATVILAQNNEDEVSVTVADTGIGIPQDAIEHLFTEFYRAPNARQIESKGTGWDFRSSKTSSPVSAGGLPSRAKLGPDELYR